MNIFDWVGAHQAALIALLIAGSLVGAAKKISTKSRDKERGTHALWAAFVLYAIGGLALTRAMIPFIHWAIGNGNSTGLGGLLGNLAAVVTFALGWHGVAMIVTMIRDLADRRPDHQARTAALWVPTLLPIGGTAVITLLQNPQGIGQGFTAAIMGVITLIYAYMIVNRVDKAVNHKNQWNWFAFGVLLLAGIVIIPMIAYTDTALIAKLPTGIRNITRAAIGLAGLGAILAGIADLWVDRVPDKWARTMAIFGVGAVVVFGAIAIAAINGAASDGASVLNGVF